MKLVRLLSAGKALVTLRDTPTAYRMRADVRLPRFGGEKNPFQRQEPASVAQPAGVKEKTDIQPGRGSLSWSAWLRRWLPGGRLERQRRGGVRPKPGGRLQAGRAGVVQGELLLERVTVVRNDLLDSDLELVVQDGGTAAVVGKSGRLWKQARAAERTLDRLAARLAGFSRL